MCLVRHACNCGTPLWSVDNCITSSWFLWINIIFACTFVLKLRCKCKSELCSVIYLSTKSKKLISLILGCIALLAFLIFLFVSTDVLHQVVQWFSTFHGLWPPSKDSQHLWPPAHQKGFAIS